MATTSSQSVLDQVFDSVTDCLTPDVARRITDIRLPALTQSRVDELARKANEGSLSDEERALYADYVEALDFLGILKAKARLALARHAD